MNIDYKKEKDLLAKAIDGDFADILEYVNPQVETMADNFLSTKRGIELEIPKQSLIKASEKYLITAINKYSEILDKEEMKEGENFIKFYTWFADKGMNEYAATWELMLNGHMGNCCGGH